MLLSWLFPQGIAQPLLQARELENLHDRQRWVAVVLASAVLVLVTELVRRRKLREEYSWVWIGTAALLLTLAISDEVLAFISNLVGSATPTSTLFFGAILFLLLLALQFSVRLSRLTQRHKTLGQRVALLEEELARQRGRLPGADEILPMREPKRRDGNDDEQRRAGAG